MRSHVQLGAVRATASIGVVTIGRNEGERLRRCLVSVLESTPWVVYVDSGSDDGSPAMAAALGAHVVTLDRERPFTAARARNEGARQLRGLAPDLELIQFVDGDCEVAPGWLRDGSAFLTARPDVGAVCGRRRERHPDRSVYNLLCDIEWDTPVGAAKACGGDVMMRTAALQQVHGYREELIAGEEPELCVRIRANGWLVWRLDAEMTLHDAAMMRFGQWWRRSMRAGYAFAEGAALHGAEPERHWVRESRSALAWGLVLPLAVVGGAVWLSPWCLMGSAIYPLQMVRLGARRGGPFRSRVARAVFLVLGKFPEAAGELRFFALRAIRSQPALIEYK